MEKSPGKTVESFQMCQLIHLQLVFAHDAGESLKFYILNNLKKPNKVQIPHFVQCMTKLNKYIKELPCLFYSPSVSVTCQILCMCPVKWQDQYHLVEKCYSKGVKPLLAILECI